MGWTEERVEMLKTLWQEGLSANQIANQIGGISRNAVIGKIHRLGLSGRAAPKHSPALPRKKPASRPNKTLGANKSAFKAPVKPKPAAVLAPVEPDCQPLMVDIASLKDNMCKWPIGDPESPDFAFCGHSKSQGMPYCPTHARMAFQPMRKREVQLETPMLSDSRIKPQRKLAG